MINKSVITFFNQPFENSVKDKKQVPKQVEPENKKEYTIDEFGNKKFGNLKSFTESKSFQLSLAKESEERSAKEKTNCIPTMPLKPSKARESL